MAEWHCAFPPIKMKPSPERNGLEEVFFFIPAAQPRPGEHRASVWTRVQSMGPPCLPCQSPDPVKASSSSPCSCRKAPSGGGALLVAPLGNDRGHHHSRFPQRSVSKKHVPWMQRVARGPGPVRRTLCRESACGGPSPAEAVQVHGVLGCHGSVTTSHMRRSRVGQGAGGFPVVPCLPGTG